MIPVIFLIILLVALLIATYRDVRTREVPDTLTAGLMVVGLYGSAALTVSELSGVTAHVAFFLILFILTVVLLAIMGDEAQLWRAKSVARFAKRFQEKTKELLIHALIAVSLVLCVGIALQVSLGAFTEHLYGFIFAYVLGMLLIYGRQWGGGDAKLLMGIGAILGFSSTNFQLLEFVILLIFSGALYGVGYVAYLAIMNKKAFTKEFMAFRRTKLVHRLLFGLVTTGFLCLALVFFVPFDVKLMLGFIVLALYILTYAWICMRVIEKTVLVKEYSVAKLTEGDWIVREVRVGRKIIVEEKNTGVTKAQIIALKQAKIKSVLVKEGIPFVPGFLLAFLALLVVQYMVGDARVLNLFF